MGVVVFGRGKVGGFCIGQVLHAERRQFEGARLPHVGVQDHVPRRLQPCLVHGLGSECREHLEGQLEGGGDGLEKMVVRLAGLTVARLG